MVGNTDGECILWVVLVSGGGGEDQLNSKINKRETGDAICYRSRPTSLANSKIPRTPTM